MLNAQLRVCVSLPCRSLLISQDIHQALASPGQMQKVVVSMVPQPHSGDTPFLCKLAPWSRLFFGKQLHKLLQQLNWKERKKKQNTKPNTTKPMHYGVRLQSGWSNSPSSSIPTSSVPSSPRRQAGEQPQLHLMDFVWEVPGLPQLTKLQ